MGYSTDFDGRIEIDPPLNFAEIDYLKAFSETRHMYREQGEYFVDFEIGYNTTEVGVYDCNKPPHRQPELWCNFIPTKDGTAIVWNECEKTYEAKEWIQYIINHFLRPNAIASKTQSPYFTDFTFDHVCNGELLAQGEDIRDRWLLIVKSNKVSTEQLR